MPETRCDGAAGRGVEVDGDRIPFGSVTQAATGIASGVSSCVTSDWQVISGGSLTTLTLIGACASCPVTPSVATASKVSVPTTFAARKAKSPRAASAASRSSPASSAAPRPTTSAGRRRHRSPLSWTIVVAFLETVDVWAPITGGVVPCSSPTTWTSWLPTRRVGEGDDGRRQRAQPAMAGRRDAEPAAERRVWSGSALEAVAPVACTTTGCAQASVVAPGSGGPAEAAVASTLPVPGGIPEVGDVDAAARRSAASRGAIWLPGLARIDLLRRPERRAAVGRHRREGAHRLRRPACQATVTRPPAATTLGVVGADEAAHERRRRRVAEHGARADDARRSPARSSGRRRASVRSQISVSICEPVEVSLRNATITRPSGQDGDRRAAVVRAVVAERRDAPRGLPRACRRCRQ